MASKTHDDFVIEHLESLEDFLTSVTFGESNVTEVNEESLWLMALTIAIGRLKAQQASLPDES
jgi:hypothetical protein